MSSSSSIPCEDPQQEQDKDCTPQEDNDALEETLLERMGGWRGVGVLHASSCGFCAR